MRATNKQHPTNLPGFVQYLGSKARIASWIVSPIENDPSIQTVVDLFAGTGTIGFSLKDEKRIVSNDIEPYASIWNHGILRGCSCSEETEVRFWDEVDALFARIEKHLRPAFDLEASFLSSPDPSKTEAYKRFCNQTPFVSLPETAIHELTGLAQLAKSVQPGEKNQTRIPFPCLFLTYYANTYFGLCQCAEIDVIRHAINSLDGLDEKNVFLAALMAAMSETASTTTHFAQFLKTTGPASFANLVQKRSTSMRKMTKRILSAFRAAGLLDGTNDKVVCKCLDCRTCLDAMPADPSTLVYADPPYFKEHYSRYYHVLNTVCLYDWPILSPNPQTGKVSSGRYRSDRIVSDFGKRSSALRAFGEIIDICAEKGFRLVISYSDNSIVDIGEIKERAKQRFDVRLSSTPLAHSKQGRKSTSSVKEFLVECVPRTNDDDWEKKVESVRQAPSTIDNPAAFLHNYMARKPFTVVAEIIRQFSPPGGTVFDPMFGSGTTLIEAAKAGRKAIGTDVNPLAFRLCSATLEKWDLDVVDREIDNFVEDVSRQCDDLYRILDNGETRIIERCHFDASDNGWTPTQYRYWPVGLLDITGPRKLAPCSESFKSDYHGFERIALSKFPDLPLMPNSRIAIPAGARTSDWFCARNRVALDRILSILSDRANLKSFPVLELIVSSAINLIRLSDKKASSQLPFWIPKTGATSRNAVMVIREKGELFKEGLRWIAPLISNAPKASVFCLPAQRLPTSVVPDGTVDLVLTDPPYADQVPYLEYAQLNLLLMKWGGTKPDDYEGELVVSDSPTRNKSTKEFHRLFDIVARRASAALKLNGIFAMFYHSLNLAEWERLFSTMKAAGLSLRAQIPIAAPRKSFKSVAAPKRNLDGNYLVVFKKAPGPVPVEFLGDLDDARKWMVGEVCAMLDANPNATTQDFYDGGILEKAWLRGVLKPLSAHYRTIPETIKHAIRFDGSAWRK